MFVVPVMPVQYVPGILGDMEATDDAPLRIKTILGSMPEPCADVAGCLWTRLSEWIPESRGFLLSGKPAIACAAGPVCALGFRGGEVTVFFLDSVTLGANRQLLDGRKTTRGSVRFPLEQGIPWPILQQLVAHRLRRLGVEPSWPGTKVRSKGPCVGAP